MVALYGRFALMDPAQTDGLAPKVIVGIGLMVTVKALAELVQPVAFLVTVRVPLYVAAGAAPGTTRTIGVAGRTALTTFTNPAARAAASYVMLYRSGVPVVALYGRLADIEPAQTLGLAPSVIVGIGFTVTLIAIAALVQVVKLFVTVRVPVYVAAGAAPGTTRTIGVAGSAALTTFTNPAAIAAALQVMLYWFGVPVVALYGRLADIEPAHTLGLAPSVIVGLGFTVTLIALAVLVHPVALIDTVKVPV